MLCGKAGVFKKNTMKFSCLCGFCHKFFCNLVYSLPFSVLVSHIMFTLVFSLFQLVYSEFYSVSFLLLSLQEKHFSEPETFEESPSGSVLVEQHMNATQTADCR